jgi:hypothetical protein
MSNNTNLTYQGCNKATTIWLCKKFKKTNDINRITSNHPSLTSSNISIRYEYFGYQHRVIHMEDNEVYEAVRAINSLVHESSVKLQTATAAIKEAEEKLKILLEATMKRTTQTSLDDFGKQETLGRLANNEAFVVKQKTNLNSNLSQEEIDIIHRMLEDVS